MPWGVARTLGGLVFSFGLVLCATTGAELFTSTSMTLIGKAAWRLSLPQVFARWTRSYAGNEVGALSVVAICFAGGLHVHADGAWRDRHDPSAYSSVPTAAPSTCSRLIPGR